MPGAFGPWVKQRRRMLDLTQRGLAERVGCSVESLRKIEGGRLRPSRQLAVLLVEALADASDDHDALLRQARSPRQANWLDPSVRQLATPALPQPLTRLIGRDRELQTISALVAERRARLLTLSGPPGVGKTHLALHAAQAVRATFAGQVVWVPLAHLHDSVAIMTTVALALGIDDGGETPIFERVAQRLREQATLLVIDNCEHIPGIAPVIVRLLATAPRLTVLATSRARLAVPGEQLLTVAPLALPPLRRAVDGEPVADLAAIAASPAVQLISERARALLPAFRVDQANALSVARLCIALDGLPLALELAAARLPLLSPRAMLERMGDRFALLGGEVRAPLGPRQTLRDTLELSYRLLSVSQQRLCEQLSVFNGATGLPAIEAVCHQQGLAGEPPEALIEQLGALVDSSLVQTTSGPDGERHFLQLATIREYGRERLVAAGAWQSTVRRHLAYFVARAEAAAPQLAGPRQSATLDALECVYGNLHAALSYALQLDEPVAGLRIATALWIYWSRNGRRSEGQYWLTALLARLPSGTLPNELRRLRLIAATLLLGLEDLEGIPGEVVVPIAEELAYWRDQGGMEELCWALHFHGLQARRSGDLHGARTSHDALVELWRGAGDRWNLGMALFCLGATCAAQGATGDAARALGESCVEFAAAGDAWSVGLAQSALGTMWAGVGEPGLARAPLAEAVASFRRANDRWRCASALDSLVAVLHRCGAHEQAARARAEAQQIRYELGLKTYEA